MLIANSRGFIQLIGLLFTIAILSIFFYFAFFHRPVQDAEVQKMMDEAGINTSNERALLDSTKSSIKRVENRLMERESEIFKQMEDY